LKKRNEPLSLGFGHYVTVWAKQPKGGWKIALDVGTENPQPPESSPGLQVLPPDIAAGTQRQENARRSLQKEERQLPRPRTTTSARPFSTAPLKTFASIAKNHFPPSSLLRPGSC
jgi:hypothetical protein